MDDLALFDAEPFVVELPEPPKLSADARRTQLQHERLAAGVHPLTGTAGYTIRLHPDAPPADDRAAPGPRCGTCWYRQSFGYHGKSYAKCLVPDGRGGEDYEKLGPPRASHGAGSDVKRWWPACRDYSPGDGAVSADAARWTPSDEAVSVGG